MSHNCRIVIDGCAVEARWQRDGNTLLVTAVSAALQAVALGEVSGISGDGFTITLQVADGNISLERLGADGPTLLQELRRDWPALRAGTLRLSGGEAPAKTFAGTVNAHECRGAFRGFLAGDRLIYALEGKDLMTLFFADCRMIACVAQDHSVVCTGWDDETTVFSKLAGETAAFGAAMQTAREKLVGAANATLSRHLPTIMPAARAKLASLWLPGRMLSLRDLESMAAGFETAFKASWLADCARAEEGGKLMDGVALSDCYLGFAVVGDAEEAMLWLLVRCADAWTLELLTQGDYATYLFTGNQEMPKLISGIVRLPEFSREALYLPIEELTEERAKYAIPARDLPLLRALRQRFAGRRIHAPKQESAAHQLE